MIDEDNKFTELNKKLQEHSVASGYGAVKKDEDATTNGNRHSASAQQTLASRQGKPSSRSAFNSAHGTGSSGHKKPMAPKPPASPAMPKPATPLKPIMPLKPLKPVGS